MEKIPDLEIIGNADNLITKIHLYLLKIGCSIDTPYLIGYEDDDFVKNITRVKFYPEPTNKDIENAAIEQVNDVMKNQLPTFSNDYETGMKAIKNNIPELSKHYKREALFIKIGKAIFIAFLLSAFLLLIF